MIRKQVYIWCLWVFKQGSRLAKVILSHRLSTLLCWGVFFFSVYQLGSIVLADYANRQVLQEAQALYEQQKEEATRLLAELDDHLQVEEAPATAQMQGRFKLLQQVNPDIVGWLVIEDTPINYPILQAEDNDYYLQRNYKQEENRAGSIFMDFRNDISSENQHTIIYGHTMRDGSMFGQLKQFTDEDFLREHRLFDFDTVTRSYTVEIFSVYRTTIDFYYLYTEFTNQEEYAFFLHDIHKRSMYELGTSVSVDDHILTLSTCDYLLDPQDGRLVIHGKLITN